MKQKLVIFQNCMSNSTNQIVTVITTYCNANTCSKLFFRMKAIKYAFPTSCSCKFGRVYNTFLGPFEGYQANFSVEAWVTKFYSKSKKKPPLHSEWSGGFFLLTNEQIIKRTFFKECVIFAEPQYS